MPRYAFYIDGFNVYHAVKDFCPEYKWLNYGSIAENVIKSHDTVESTIYFTALAKWKNKEVVDRHRRYIRALRSAKVEVVYGDFIKVDKTCKKCGQDFRTHEEKRTDVNIAIRVFTDALDDVYDRALIISADGDLRPAIEAIHKFAPDKEVGIMFPIGRTCFDLKNIVDFNFKMPKELLKKCQFPDVVDLGNSKVEIPLRWKQQRNAARKQT